MPSLIAFASEYVERGLVLVLVNQGEDPVRVRSWAKNRGVQIPVLVDPGRHAGTLYRVDGLPTMVIVGRDGKVIGKRIGGEFFAEPMWRATHGRSMMDAVMQAP